MHDSIYPGVYSTGSAWTGEISVNGKTVRTGTASDPHECARIRARYINDNGLNPGLNSPIVPVRSSKDGRLTLHEMQELFDYDPDTGVMLWKRRVGPNTFAGDPVGGLPAQRGRLTTTLGGAIYTISHLAYQMYYKTRPTRVGIVNGNQYDIRACNLVNWDALMACEDTDEHVFLDTDTGMYIGMYISAGRTMAYTPRYATWQEAETELVKVAPIKADRKSRYRRAPQS